MQGKEKHILEEGESSTCQYKRTARISRRSYVNEWLQTADDLQSEGPPPSDETCSPMVQSDPPGGQPPIEADQARVPLREEIGERELEQETMDPLKIESVEGDLQLLQSDQLHQEMRRMGEFNKNTLGSQDVPLQPDQSEDLDPLQYMQEPLEENLKENQMAKSEEDPEERPQDVNPAGELSRKNQAEPGGEPAVAEAEADAVDDEEENDDENEEDEDAEEDDEADEAKDDDENENEDDDEHENEDDEENEDEDDDENEDEDEEEDDDENEDKDDDEDENGEAVDEDVGTASPTSTVTTV